MEHMICHKYDMLQIAFQLLYRIYIIDRAKNFLFNSYIKINVMLYGFEPVKHHKQPVSDRRQILI